MLAPDESTSAHPNATDDDLVERARAGDASAYGELWRRHSGIGTSIARRYYEIADADDIVSESFARILSTLQRGGGPRSGFRPYLVATIGNVARRWATRSREGASDELDLLEDPKTLDDPVVASTDRAFALEAFRSLPDRWQAVLWYSAVEGMGPTDVAGHLGMTPNAAAVLAHRARAGLRTAWIQAHLNDSTLSDDCRWTYGRLGRRATGSLSAREHERVRQHLATCLECRARARELDQLTGKLAVLLVPALLGLGALDSDDSAMAATITAEPAVPALTATHVWLVGIAAAVVTATALFTASTPAATEELHRVALQPSAAPVERTIDEVLAESPPAAQTAESDATPSAAETDPVPSAGPSGGSEPVPAAARIPAVPTVIASLDPDSVRPPTLTGTAAAGALVVITDELGAEVGRTAADAAGEWASGELTALSAAAASLSIRQLDGAGLASPAAVVGPLAFRPQITGPADGYLSYGAAAFDITVQGWPGSTIEATFEPIEAYGHTEPTSYPTALVSVDADGNGVVHIDGSVYWHHHVTLHYVDGGRSSSGQVGMTFALTAWPD